MEALSKLANSETFRKQLVTAQKDPTSRASKLLNSKILKVLSMVGSTVPFSPFERSATRPKISAMRRRFGISSTFVTVAPPEFEDETVLRLALIKNYNSPCCKLSSSNFQRSDLPDDVLHSVGIRMRMTKERPVLAAENYRRKQRQFTKAVLQCPESSETRVARNFTERKRGAFGPTAAFIAVTEPQKSGRLHFHLMQYSSNLTAPFLHRLAAAPQYVTQHIGEYIDSTCLTRLSAKTHSWMQEFNSNESMERPRAADIVVPDAALDYCGFVQAAEQKSALVGTHVHNFSCEKGKLALLDVVSASLEAYTLKPLAP